jgi:hypothetical protein
MECALGLQTANQKNYALKNNPNYDVPTGVDVTVTGSLATTADKTYDIVGTIDVKMLQTKNP